MTSTKCNDRQRKNSARSQRCGAPSVYTWTHPRQNDIHLCRVHDAEHGPGMPRAGFEPTDREAS